MFFTISVCAKTYVTIFKVIPFAIPNRRYKQIAVAINTKKHSFFSQSRNQNRHIKNEK